MPPTELWTRTGAAAPRSGAAAEPVAVPAAPRRPKRVNAKRYLTGYLFIAPAVILFAVFGVYTVGYGLALSFASWNGLAPQWTWVGLQNFRDLFLNDPLLAPVVQASAGRTAVVMVVLPLATIAISLPIAVLLNSVRRFRAPLRTIYLLPFVTSGNAVFYAWRFMYEPDGIINTCLRAIGLGALAEPDGFLGNPDTALAATVWVQIWVSVPLGILLYLTGLQTVDGELIDAARVDGAGSVRAFRHVIVPLLNPLTALLVIIQVREALQSFQIYLLMTNGGPIDRTNVLGLEVFKLAFSPSANLGQASALGWTLFVVALVLAIVNLRILRSRS
ncbi:sugar ABC transporter permease [Kribbella sp. NBC_01245]|uniref:carbohydrate ABC transporter permease n=1 Tax=Kribbella sp. NBC_01245 TaxID=2903578 RepID=UPI002E2DAF25|nr:sugar ABC transporter permease [Kribbella sp. NBC_01245]